MRRTYSYLLCAAMAAAFSGCASSTRPPAVDWEHGARRGWVVSTFTPDFGSVVPPCLARLPAGELATHSYIKVHYRAGRLMREAVAPLPPGLAVTDGQQVEVWPANCASGQLARISRILPAPGDGI